MHERVHAERGDVGLLLEVEGRLEERMRIAPLGGARPQVVDERILAGARDVRVVLEVEGGVEERVRIEPLRRSAREVVHDGVEPGLIEAACLGPVVLRVEQPSAG